MWILWFLVPPTREVARSEWKARFLTVPTTIPTAVDDTSRDAAFVRALDKLNGAGKPDNNALEELGRSYPGDASICAAQIVATSGGLNLGGTRQPGPSSNADPNWSVKLAKIKATSPAVLQSWFAATARGAKLEPNNTFWDWAQIMGLLAARRDDEVWPVLRAARNKTVYDDHANDGALANLRLVRQQAVVAPIQQISIAASILFPHFAVMREAARQVSDDASGLRLSGEPAKQKQALEGLRDFAALSRVMRRESKSYIGSLVGMAMESISLYGGAYSPLSPKTGRHPAPGVSVAVYGSDPRSLLAFARKQGRNDVVAQLSSQWLEMGNWRAKTRGAAGNSLLIGLNVRDLGLAQGGDWFGSLLIAGIPTLLVVAVGCSLLLRLVPAWRRESEAQPSPLSWAWGAFLGMAALITLSSALICVLWIVWRIAGATILDLLLAPLSGGNTVGFAPLAWQYHFPALLGFLCALWLASVWDARRQGKPTLGAKLRRLFHPPDDGMAHIDLSPLLTLAATLGAFFLLTFGVLCFLIVPSTNEDFKSLHDYAGLFLVGFAIVLSFPWLWRLRTAQGRAFALILARRFAWGQLLFLTILWGLLWMFAMPAQHRFDAQFTRQLQIGEFQLVRKQVGL